MNELYSVIGISIIVRFEYSIMTFSKYFQSARFSNQCPSVIGENFQGATSCICPCQIDSLILYELLNNFYYVIRYNVNYVISIFFSYYT